MGTFSADAFNEAVGRRLHALRQARGLTQTAMAQQLGLGIRTYQNYERGEREISAQAVRNAHHVFGVDPVWLLDGIENEPLDHWSADADTLEIVLEEVERRLEAGRIRLPPRKKVELIMIIYRHFSTAQSPDQAFVENAIRLVA